MHARYFSAHLGRFHSIDPVGGVPELPQSWNGREGANRFAVAAVTRATFRYHFNPQVFVRAIVQHRDVKRDLSLYVPPVRVRPEEESLFGQHLFAYKLNARRLLFLGYTEDEVGDQNFDLTRQERAFFLKASYALLW